MRGRGEERDNGREENASEREMEERGEGGEEEESSSVIWGNCKSGIASFFFLRVLSRAWGQREKESERERNQISRRIQFEKSNKTKMK